MGFALESSRKPTWVLIVEDDPFMRDSLVAALTAWGYHVHTATTVDEARRTLDANPIDAVVSDVRLPGNGLTLLDDIDPRDLPIVFVTGANDAKVRHYAFERGAAAFLVKPLDLLRLQATLASVVRRE